MVVVDVDPDVQLARVRDRDGLGDDDARARVQAQAGRDARLAAADVVIHNDGTRDDLAREVDAFWQRWVVPAEGA